MLGFSYRIRMRVSRVISVLRFLFSSWSCLSCWQVVWQFLLIVVVWQLVIFVVVWYYCSKTLINLSIDRCMLWFIWEEKLKLTKMVYV